MLQVKEEQQKLCSATITNYGLTIKTEHGIISGY
jgi:hypothetical protein